jgi:hypothetical protein
MKRQLERLVCLLLDGDIITEQRAAEELGIGLVDMRELFGQWEINKL